MMVLTLPEITMVSPSLYELAFVSTEINDSAKTGKVKTINKIKTPEIILIFINSWLRDSIFPLLS